MGKIPPQQRPSAFRIFRDIFGLGAILIVGSVAPLVLDRLAGRGWGLAAAVATIGAWFYIDRRFLRKGALSTRLIWFLWLGYLVLILVFECARFFHQK